jgi:hypothetical protein
MLKLVINIEAKTQSGLEDSIREALRVIEKGNRSGMDENSEESYDFEITGKEEQLVKVKIVKSKILKKGFDIVTIDGSIKYGTFKTKQEAKYWVYDEDELELVEKF